MNHPAWLALAVPLVVTVVLLFAAGSAFIEYRKRVAMFLNFVLTNLKGVDHNAGQLTEQKNRWLDFWLGWSGFIPHLADAVTLSRLFFIGRALVMFSAHQQSAAIWAFSIGWLTDFLDGPLARIRSRRTGRANRYGKYLDVGVDLICFAAMVTQMYHWFPAWLLVVFGTTVIIRAVYGLGLFLRRWLTWISLTFLPDSTTGKYKTIFVGLAFGLIIGWPDSRLVNDWAIGTLALAMILEMISLSQQAIRAIRLRNAGPSAAEIVPLPRAINE